MIDKRRILIVDDEKTFTQMLKLNLEESGEYEVRTENDSRRAHKIARKFMPDIIVLDIMMPHKDGFTVLKEIKNDPETMAIPVIMLTAVKEDAAKYKASGLYSEDYLTKPITTQELIAKIEDILIRR